MSVAQPTESAGSRPKPWRRVDVHHHGSELDRLIVDTIGPLLVELCRHDLQATYTRHWRQGPHVRLHVRADATDLEHVVLPAVERIISPYLRTLPETNLDVGELLEEHRKLASAEVEAGPLTPFIPDNTWRLAEHDMRLVAHGTAEASDLTHEFLCATTEDALAVAANVVAGGSLLSAVFDRMVVTVDRFSGGIDSGFLSFRSHGDAYLARREDGEEVRAAWQRHHRAHADQLLARVGALTGDNAIDPSDLGIADFLKALLHHRDRGKALLNAGLLPLGEHMAESSAHTRPSSATHEEWLRRSSFHRALKDNQVWQETVRNSEAFWLFRLVLNLAYLHFTRLGLPGEHRFLLCYLVAETMEQKLGRSAIDVLAESTRRGSR